MVALKLLALVALAGVVTAHEICAVPVTVTVTVSECGPGPVNPAPTPPLSYALPPAPLSSSVESTATAPLSGHPEVPTPVVPAPAPPVSGVPVVPTSGAPGVPDVPGVSTSALVTLPSSGVPVVSSAGLAPSSLTTAHPSTTAANLHPSPSKSGAPEISTAAAPLATPMVNRNSLWVAGAAAVVAVMA